MNKTIPKAKFRKKEKSKIFRKNQQITAKEVRVISEDGEMLGIMPTAEALQQAQAEGVDLVEVNPIADPPVCKLINFGKMKYEKDKAERKQKAKQKKIETKGIRLSVTIADNDLQIRVKQANKFLNKGNKIQIQLQLRGRQKAYPEKAVEMINKFLDLIDREKIKIEQPIKKQGGRFTCLIGPKK